MANQYSTYGGQPPLQERPAVELPAPGDRGQPVELLADLDGARLHGVQNLPALPPGFRLVYDPSYQAESEENRRAPPAGHRGSTHAEPPLSPPVPINRAPAGPPAAASRAADLPPTYEAATSSLHLDRSETQASWASSPQAGSKSSYLGNSCVSPLTGPYSSHPVDGPISPSESRQSMKIGHHQNQSAAEYQQPYPERAFPLPLAGYQPAYQNSGSFGPQQGGIKVNYPIDGGVNQPGVYASTPIYQSPRGNAPQMRHPSTYSNNSSWDPQPTLQDAFASLQVSSSNLSSSSEFVDLETIRVYDEPVRHVIDTHHHALKALKGAPETVAAFSAILGSYLRLKRDHEYAHSASRFAHHSRPDIVSYNNIMHKLETLSHDFVSKHKSAAPAWSQAVGPHRRLIFAELYNQNDLVRSFCKEMPNGPRTLPHLDEYALGYMRTNYSPPRASVRAANLSGSFEVLSRVRTVFLIDDSGSMLDPGHRSWGGGQMNESRWAQAGRMVAAIAPMVARYSPLGVDLHFLNRSAWYNGLRTQQDAERAFAADWPDNGTRTGQRVHDILDSYMATLRYYRALMPLNLIVVTDGEAQDEELLHWSIEEHVTKLVHRGFPAHQFGIEFVQVGDCMHATRHLIKLEEEVSRHHSRFQRDVVGVTPITRVGRMGPEEMLGIAISGIDARMNGYMRYRQINV